MNVYTFEQQKEKYMHDPEFHALVNQFHSFLKSGQITQDTMRGALNFAVTKFYFEDVKHSYTNDSIDALSYLISDCSQKCKNFKRKAK